MEGVTQVQLEQFKYATHMMLAEEYVTDLWAGIDVDVSSHASWGGNDMILRLVGKSYGRLLEEKEVRYPTTWWDAFKEQAFPYWLRKKVKINYTTKTLTARELCPEIPLDKHIKTVVVYDLHNS